MVLIKYIFFAFSEWRFVLHDISGQTHGFNIKKSQQEPRIRRWAPGLNKVHYIVLKKQFYMCFLAKMYILYQSFRQNVFIF